MHINRYDDSIGCIYIYFCSTFISKARCSTINKWGSIELTSPYILTLGSNARIWVRLWFLFTAECEECQQDEEVGFQGICFW